MDRGSPGSNNPPPAAARPSRAKPVAQKLAILYKDEGDDFDDDDEEIKSEIDSDFMAGKEEGKESKQAAAGTGATIDAANGFQAAAAAPSYSMAERPK